MCMAAPYRPEQLGTLGFPQLAAWTQIGRNVGGEFEPGGRMGGEAVRKLSLGMPGPSTQGCLI